ncbi:integrase core domain-containing protein, partial [Legionella quinlivanii]|uniref:integrase core domain-containing protein n=1 Tax=Legionella quinlivanii TaxID=45073 RepID=UPI003BF90396
HSIVVIVILLVLFLVVNLKLGGPVYLGGITNRTYRNEILDFYLFRNLNEVREITGKWMKEYNEVAPRKGLKMMAPREYIRSLLAVS